MLLKVYIIFICGYCKIKRMYAQPVVFQCYLYQVSAIPRAKRGVWSPASRFDAAVGELRCSSHRKSRHVRHRFHTPSRQASLSLASVFLSGWFAFSTYLINHLLFLLICWPDSLVQQRLDERVQNVSLQGYRAEGRLCSRPVLTEQA